MEATREDAFLVTTRHGVAVTGHMSADADGNIVAASADVRYDTGAYADIGPRITAKSGMVACGPYRMATARVRSRCVYTNKPSAGPYRGFGVPQVTLGHETLVDELARARGEDPAAYRRRHLLREGDTAAVGTVMHSADFVGCLDAATAAIGWDSPLRREEGPWRWGRGVAVGMKAVLTPTVSNAVLQLNQDATATLAHLHRGHGAGQRHDHGADRRRGAVPRPRPGARGRRRHRRHAVRHHHSGQPLHVSHRQRGPAGRRAHAGPAGHPRRRAAAACPRRTAS